MVKVFGLRIEKITGMNIKFYNGDTLPANNGDIIDTALSLRHQYVDLTVSSGKIISMTKQEFIQQPASEPNGTD